MATFNELVRKLISLPEDKRNAVLEKLKVDNLEGYAKLTLYFKANPGVIHEARGWDHWLKYLGPHTFYGSFAPFHEDLWRWYWPATIKQQDGEALNLEDITYFAIWGRGLGKSSSAEWLAIAEGCLIGKGFVLYVCHEKGTLIFDPNRPELGWHLVETHPSAREVRRESVRVELVGLPKAHAEYVTPEHQYWARRIASRQIKHVGQDTRYGEPHWIEAKHLDWNTWIGYPIDYSICSESEYPLLTKWKGAWRGGKYEQVEFPLFENPEFWWMVGLWWGDGTLGGPKRGNISFACGDAHPEVKDYLVMLLKEWGYSVLQTRPKSGAKLTDVVFSDRSLSQWLSTWKRGRSRKEPPSWVEHLPFECQRQLIKGYLAADGYVSERGIKLTSIHLPGLLAVRRMLMRLGVTCTIACKRHKIEHQLFPDGRICPVAPSFTLDIDRPDLLGLEGINERPNKDLLGLFIRDGFLWSRVRDAEPNGERVFIPITTKDHSYLTVFGRSHNCGTQDQADSHVEAIRDRLEAEETLHKSYPGMRKPSGAKGFVSEHKRYGWRQDFLMTANGWAIRPVGLDKAIRGWKRGDNRVSLIILDDIDDDDDSPEVILKKERRIAKKILPMGTARTKVVFAQNLIHSNSVLNRMHTRQNNMLAVRRGDEAVKSFQEIKTEFRQTETGPRHIITHYVPTWKDLDITEAQSFLDRSDLPAFLAEYQHDFTGEQNERVLPEYDDRVLRTNLITWSQFEALYGQRRIPAEWCTDVGLDVGFTTGHLSAWTFLSKAPEGYPLAGSVFRYRGRTFTSMEIGDQSAEVTSTLWPDEQLQREWSSHEGESERLTLNQKHGWHFHTCKFGKKDGVSQWRHLLKADKAQPHPCHRDEKDDKGVWRIGRPAWFDVVDDDQFIQPKDDKGLKVHRDQAYKWKMRPVEETKSGMTVEQPMKADEDTCDSTRMCTASFGPVSKPQTTQQKIAAAIPQGYHRQELAQRTDLDPARKEMTSFMAEFLASKAIKKPAKLYDAHGRAIG